MEQYNQRSPAVKRLMKEAQELRDATEDYFAQPLEDNLFEWHFTVRGPPDSDFQGGVYHGRIVLPSEYPMKPPNIIIMTPNGRFETNKKICLSISGHHPESWQPSWSLRTAMLALIGFMPTEGEGAIGSLECSSEERKKLARRSANFICPRCGNTRQLLKERSPGGPSAANKEAKELATQMSFTSDTAKPQQQQQQQQLQEHPKQQVDAQRAQPDKVDPQADQNRMERLTAAEVSNATPLAPGPAPESIESGELRQRALDQRITPSSTTAVVANINSTGQTPREVTATAPAAASASVPWTGTRRVTAARGGPGERGPAMSIDYRMLINVLMAICAAGFLSLCIRRVCFL